MISKVLTLAAASVLVACATTPPPNSQQPVSEYIGPQILPFDLVCKRPLPGQGDLVFRVARAPDGAAIVTTMNDKPLLDYETHTYMNAYMWTNGKERYLVDRMTGVLTTKPGDGTYNCERQGPQRF